MSDRLPPDDQPPIGSSLPRPSVSAAITWAFDRFRAHAAAFVGLAAVVTVIQILQQIGTRPLENILIDCSDPQTLGQTNACNAALGAGALTAIGITVLFLILGVIATVGVQRAAIRTTQGVTPTFSEMFTTENLGKYLLLTLVYVLLVVVGVMLCILPGIIVLFLLQLGPYYVLDKGYGVGQAIRASVRAVMGNIGPVLVMTLFNGLVLILGGMLYGILTLVALPFATLFTANMYRQLNHEPVG